MRRPYTALTLLALACSLTACGNGAGSGASSPATTTAPATTSTASATTASSASASVDPSQDPLYLEAVDVYTKYFAEMQKFEAAGYPTRSLPPTISQYLTADVVNAVTQSINAAQDRNLRLKAGESSALAAVAPDPGVHSASSVIALRVCSDARSTAVVDSKSGKFVQPGVLAYKEIFFIPNGASLKISDIQGKVVTKCPIA